MAFDRKLSDALMTAETALAANPTPENKAAYEAAYQAVRAIAAPPKVARFASRAGQRQAAEMRSRYSR